MVPCSLHIIWDILFMVKLHLITEGAFTLSACFVKGKRQNKYGYNIYLLLFSSFVFFTDFKCEIV